MLIFIGFNSNLETFDHEKSSYFFSFSACHTDLDCLKDTEATGDDHRLKRDEGNEGDDDRS